MNTDPEDTIYHDVLRETFWGTRRAEILETLQEKGIVGPVAEELLRRAERERAAHVRAEGLRKTIKGVLFMAIGSGLFSVFWFIMGILPRGIFIISGLVALYGLWNLIDGATKMLSGRSGGSVNSDF